MADSEISTISNLISKELSSTPYACSSLTRLSGGTANFVFRGVLAQPVAPEGDTHDDATRVVIVKHGEGYVASNREFKLSTERCVRFPIQICLYTCIALNIYSGIDPLY